MVPCLNEQQCPVCHFSARNLESESRTFAFSCARCGSFELVFEAKHSLEQLRDDDRPKLSSWIRDQESQGLRARLTEEILRYVSNLSPEPFFEKAKRLLTWMARKNADFGVVFQLEEEPAAGSVIQTFSPEHLAFVAEYMEEQKWLKRSQQIQTGYMAESNIQTLPFSITGNGWKQIDEWQSNSRQSNQSFVAMWFDPCMDEAWTYGLERGIRDAGFLPKRIDKMEHANKICDEIIAEIRQSKFIVVDLTGQRCGVYFEAGFAQGLGLPVIWTCSKEEIDNNKLHFDVRQYNCIGWSKPDELREKLAVRISAVIGRGPGQRNDL